MWPSSTPHSWNSWSSTGPWARSKGCKTLANLRRKSPGPYTLSSSSISQGKLLRAVLPIILMLDAAAGESRPAARALHPPALNPPHGSCRMTPAVLAEALLETKSGKLLQAAHATPPEVDATCHHRYHCSRYGDAGRGPTRVGSRTTLDALAGAAAVALRAGDAQRPFVALSTAGGDSQNLTAQATALNNI